jgi:hypothetical protein
LNVKIQNKLRLYNIKIQVAVPYSMDSESLNIYYYIVIVLLKPTLTYSHSFFSSTLIEQVGHRCSNNGANNSQLTY